MCSGGVGMSGWVSVDPPCPRCKDSGFADVVLLGWGSLLCLVECPDCYPYQEYSYWYEMWVRDVEAHVKRTPEVGA